MVIRSNMNTCEATTKVVSGMDVVDNLMIFDRIERATLSRRLKN